jgi:hypothetical protein
MAISPAMLVFGSKSSKHNGHLVKPVWPSCWSPRKWWFHLKSVASEWRRQDSSLKVNQIRWFQNPLPMQNSMCLGCRVDMNMSIHLTYMSHITSALHMWQSLQSKKNALAFTGRCSTKTFNQLRNWEPWNAMECHGSPGFLFQNGQNDRESKGNQSPRFHQVVAARVPTQTPGNPRYTACTKIMMIMSSNLYSYYEQWQQWQQWQQQLDVAAWSLKKHHHDMTFRSYLWHSLTVILVLPHAMVETWYMGYDHPVTI